jgi:hypothetical protein
MDFERVCCIHRVDEGGSGGGIVPVLNGKAILGIAATKYRAKDEHNHYRKGENPKY